MTLLRVIAKCSITKHHLQLGNQKPAVILQDMPPCRSLSHSLEITFSRTDTQIIQPQHKPVAVVGEWSGLTLRILFAKRGP